MNEFVYVRRISKTETARNFIGWRIGSLRIFQLLQMNVFVFLWPIKLFRTAFRWTLHNQTSTFFCVVETFFVKSFNRKVDDEWVSERDLISIASEQVPSNEFLFLFWEMCFLAVDSDVIDDEIRVHSSFLSYVMTMKLCKRVSMMWTIQKSKTKRLP